MELSRPAMDYDVKKQTKQKEEAACIYENPFVSRSPKASGRNCQQLQKLKNVLSTAKPRGLCENPWKNRAAPAVRKNSVLSRCSPAGRSESTTRVKADPFPATGQTTPAVETRDMPRFSGPPSRERRRGGRKILRGWSISKTGYRLKSQSADGKPPIGALFPIPSCLRFSRGFSDKIRRPRSA